jgi:[acyl-carrier-protein] S-malonyltransferase
MKRMAHILGLFPGQGSQKVGMGKDLFAESALAREIFAAADQALGFSLSTICFEGPAERLTATEIAQPAILTVSTICYRLAAEAGLGLTAAAGHSLGEYSALVAAGALRFEDAVVLVHKRGKYMQSAVPVGAGKMVAVLGKELEAIEAAIAAVSNGIVQVANINSPGQIVVAGSASAVDAFKGALGDARMTDLVVSAPFHCALMQPAADLLAVDLDACSISPAAFPVYANVTAAPVRTPDEIRAALKAQVCGRVRWIESMQNAIKIESIDRAIEFGAGAVLVGLLKRINGAVPRQSVGALADVSSAVAGA